MWEIEYILESIENFNFSVVGCITTISQYGFVTKRDCIKNPCIRCRNKEAYMRKWTETIKTIQNKNLPLQDRQQKHVLCTALVMNNNK